MVKKIALFISVLLTFACVVSLAACTETINGESAYELAVKNGFEGTETEWLDSLKGTDGKDGKNGTNGTNGTNGRDGKDNTLTIDDYFDAAKEGGYEGNKVDFIKETLSDLSLGNANINVAKNLLSSVSVACKFDRAASFIMGKTESETITSGGSGVIYKLDKQAGDAYIITNYHVIHNVDSSGKGEISKDISVYLYGGETGNQAIPAKFVGGALKYDIALLYVENSEELKKSSAEEVEFFDSNKIVVGQTAIAIGNARGEGISVTSGIISVDSENITDSTGKADFRAVRIDCAVNKGNSGGGLFDADGKLIGIVNAKIITTDVENIAYALPSNVVRYVAENVMYDRENGGDGKVKKCMLGITVVGDDSKAVYDSVKCETRIEEKVTVYEVYDEEKREDTRIKEGDAAYGKLKGGDVIKRIKFDRDGDGEYEEVHEITRNFIIVDLMLTVRVGDKIIVVIDRTEKTETDGVATEVTEEKEIEIEMTEQNVTIVE